MALAGLALGVYNTFTQRRDKRPRIRVTVRKDMFVLVPGEGASERKVKSLLTRVRTMSKREVEKFAKG